MEESLEHKAGLNYNQCVERVNKVREEFGEVKQRYSGFWRKFRRRINKADQTTLVNCVGVLLPLGLEESVQQEVIEMGPKEQTLFYQIGRLGQEIMSYLASFRNTGVKEYRMKEPVHS